ncbi:hypothetical protein FB45DRAFT_1060534 [Roridomyces roridus]|uniref:DUF6533 domain-containing protein n=1 Tax=Roridomyces roridus TaxID=1738132 RepID=A0AAD7BN58_9AGAR|nr:hypothetical protein FB45DRAFT_1060534 [Roridomyces roridus]
MSLRSPNVSFVQGSAISALTWVLYDLCLTVDREVYSVWRSAWSLSKCLFIFSRYHTILALGFFLMEAIGTKHFTLPLAVGGGPKSPSFYAPCIANLKVSIPLAYGSRESTAASNSSTSIASRWYLGMTEIFSILTGELLILLRINSVYGWSRGVVVLTLFLFSAEAVIGIVTTVLSIAGGSKNLLGSTRILDCTPGQANIPDVNIAMWSVINPHFEATIVDFD